MMNPFHPLEVNSHTGEPFVRLPSPLENIIITPMRDSDKPKMIEYMNDWRIVQYFRGPPYPYLQEHADVWVAAQNDTRDRLFKELTEDVAIGEEKPLKIVDACPVRSIREVQADGTDVFIGDIFVHRAEFEYLQREEQKTKADENDAKSTGDPSIVWTVGDYLAPSHHSRGIMSAVLGALMKAWVIPRMNAHVMEGVAFIGNVGSIRVFEKNGFKMLEAFEDCIEVKGERIGLQLLEWRLEQQ